MSVAQASISQLKDEISARLDALRPELERIGRDIYANPEIAYEERQAVAWLTELLKKYGFAVEVGVANTPTAFVATRRNGSGPTIAFLAEYDALRGLGHGCGHNLIGTAPNIIPERTSGEFLVRARDEAYMQELVQKVKNIFQAAALATGCSVKLSFDESPYADLRNNGVLAKLFEGNLQRLRIDPVEGVPWENAGSTDMGNVSHVVPALHPTIGIAPSEVPGHSQAFLEASGSPRGYQAMIDAAKALAMTGADLLSDPELVEQAKGEFRRS